MGEYWLQSKKKKTTEISFLKKVFKDPAIDHKDIENLKTKIKGLNQEKKKDMVYKDCAIHRENIYSNK